MMLPALYLSGCGIMGSALICMILFPFLVLIFFIGIFGNIFKQSRKFIGRPEALNEPDNTGVKAATLFTIVLIVEASYVERPSRGICR